MRSRGIRSSGPSVSSATSLTAARNSLTRAASSVSPAACRWPPNRMSRCAQRSSAPSMSKLRDAAARAVRHAVLDRQHDRRPVKRVDQLRRDDADDAAVPALAGDDENRARADVRIGLDDFLRRGEDLRLFLLAPDVLAVELQRQRPRLVAHAPRRSASSSRVAMSGVLMRPAAFTRGASMNDDVIAVDRLARSGPRRRAARAGPTLCGPARQQVEAELGDDAVLADERHDVGQRADGGDLDEARQPAVAAGAPAQAPARASARRRRRPGTCRDSCSRAASD